MSGIAILVTSAGRRVGLLNCFRDSCARLGVPVRILAGDLRPELSAACSAADAAFALPAVSDPAYAAAVEEICAREGVGLVVPTIDTELRALAEAAPRLEALGARVNVPSPATVRIARDKLETAHVLAAAGVATPASAAFGSPDIGTPALPYPLIAKPRDGSSSAGLRLITGDADLRALGAGENYVLQERLAGAEFTVNLFAGPDGTMQAAVPHRRIETRAGEVSKGRTERHEALTETARKLAEALPGLRGAICFQCFATERGPVVFEVNARFGGGYPLAHAAGARFTQWLIEEALDLPSTASDNWRENVLMLRYDAEIFV